MITRIVEHHDHAAAARSINQQLREKTLESRGVEDLGRSTDELPGAQVDGPKAGNGFAGRRMQEDGILVLRRYPHATARTVLLEVTFVQAPQINVRPSSQAA
jgi:hypothetical protein